VGVLRLSASGEEQQADEGKAKFHRDFPNFSPRVYISGILKVREDAGGGLRWQRPPVGRNARRQRYARHVFFDGCESDDLLILEY
jgi:hypothetical protein